MFSYYVTGSMHPKLPLTLKAVGNGFFDERQD